ncbi:hypothetical protein EUU22_10855 [Ciceribacter ferrooxidans]|uniref:Uncharacterized protein n=1 Tax=Ciceribacter ferrooxidans TaxID=2509717 RepID=A0A4Q2T5S5_9HYPH|nr:hypothetical protein EUU22_10855 [Ciceribacter ferrooxidans]
MGKVEMSLWSPHGMPISPDLTGWTGLQDQIGAGEAHPVGFSLETIQPLIHSAASSRDNASFRRATTAGSCMKSLLRPGLRPRGL